MCKRYQEKKSFAYFIFDEHKAVKKKVQMEAIYLQGT